MDGGLFGGQIGYNWQTANWVFGIETDAQWTGQKGSTTVLCPVAGCFPTAVAAGTGVGAAISDKLEWFGTFRGRVGVTVTPSVLLYATGGGAYGSLQTEVGLSGFTATGIPVTAIGSRSVDKFGWTVGGWHRGDVLPATGAPRSNISTWISARSAIRSFSRPRPDFLSGPTSPVA